LTARGPLPITITAWGLAAFGLLAAGCLEKTPPPAKGYEIGDGEIVVPPPSHDAGLDADFADGAFSDAEGGAAAWAGTWQYVSGSDGNLCGGSLAVIAASGFLDITPSTSGTLLRVVEDGCPFTFDLAGNVATEEPDQSCAAWAIQTIPIWTLTMQPDGTLHEMIGGRVVVGSEICTLSGSATLVRQ
jgi:hypothetical protein